MGMSTEGGTRAGDGIPVIDLALSGGGAEDQAELRRQVREACSTWGFFQLLNHGIDVDLMSAMGNFFALPFETKRDLKRNATCARGYFDDELTKRRRDWKEALDVGSPGSGQWSLPDADNSNGCLDGRNQLPAEEDCPGFRDTVVLYFEACSKLSDKLARLMFDESEADQLLERMKHDHTSYLRMNYYPPATPGIDENADSNLHNNTFSNTPAKEGTLGISPHRDAGLLTILLQDENTHSLQVARFEDSDNVGESEDWVTVHPVPGSLTINTGDMAAILSNGLFRAPLHRVLTDSNRTRYSAPFFYNPGYNELITPLQSFCERHERRYRACCWGYFRALRFAGDLTDLGVEIQTSHFKVDSDSDHPAKQKRFLEVVNFDEPFNVEKYRNILEDKDVIDEDLQ